ncbi:MAG: GNAT family N-acetyltransferase [Rickettsia sp.]|nr:GNAT family N-acetyltransferase [Rickettsia sp.]
MFSLYSEFENVFPDLKINNEIMLRSFQKDDAYDYFHYMSNPVMKNYVTSDNIPGNYLESIKEIEYWRSLFHRKIGIYWAIALVNNNKIIGSIGFNSISFIFSTADISYDLNPKYWKKGIMCLSMSKIVKYAKSILGLKEITATVVQWNYPSIKLLHKLGFYKLKIIKNYTMLEGENADCVLYSKKLNNRPI